MVNTKDGGPAFPGEHLNPEAFDVLRNNRDLFSVQDARALASRHAGMSLRDYLAAKALQGLISKEGSVNPQLDAHLAYMLADAMIKEREKYVE